MAFHNHPSGDTTPSDQDIQLTHRLVEAGELLGIKLLDHLIIGGGSFTSLKRKRIFIEVLSHEIKLLSPLSMFRIKKE